ncbi:MAG TPA: hypothetical protein VMR95_04570 [Candidatus Binatia bacterium]|nr:hypothetical protein [Candidatus Binatia bacterium]
MKLLNPLFQKEVTRKEFLTIAALGVASIAGIGTILELLTGKSPKTSLHQYTSGYSASDYGGKKSASDLSSKL